jgi:hypothetical protein
MKQQFRKGFTQNFKGKPYKIYVIKLGCKKFIIREEIISRK